MTPDAKPVIFYGWWDVAASFVGLALSYAMFTVFSFGTFVGPLQAEFGWQRGPMSLALTIANISVVIEIFHEHSEFPSVTALCRRR